MLCGIKLRLDSHAISQLLKNSNLEFKSSLNTTTGEIDHKLSWERGKMKIQIKNSGYGVIRGSLHMFKNGGHHNYDDFSWEQVFQTVADLSEVLNLDVEHLNLNNLEWGLNIETDLSPKLILSGLVMHKGLPFKNMYVHPGTHYTCSHAQFSIKAYDKGKQFRLPLNLLRVELAANRSAFINNLGVYSLNDLRRDDTKANLQNYLLYGGWNDAILIEPELLEYRTKSNKERLKISNWTNPNFWLNATKRVRCYQKKEYDKFRLSNGFDTKEKIFQSILEKFREL